MGYGHTGGGELMLRYSGGEDSPPSLRSASTRPVVRRLTERDRTALQALLDHDAGFSLFLAGNLARFGLTSSFVRFWGLFAQGRLVAALMMVGLRATVSAPLGLDVAPLAQVAGEQEMDFTMGRTDLVDALVHSAWSEQPARREEHYLAQLTPDHLHTEAATPRPGVHVRPAGPRDLDALTRFYLGSDGFEGLSSTKVRQALSGRVRAPLRTYLAELDGRIVSAASTSAEASTAAMIGGVWTAPEARNRGLSTAVVAALSANLLGEGRWPYLFYLMGNSAAAAVYAKVGFTVAGRWSVAYQHDPVAL